MSIVVEQTKSPQLGDYWALRNEGTARPFKNKMTEAYSIPIFKDDIVADIGAYVGEYSMYAAMQGAAEVRSFEASPFTFGVLCRNQRGAMSPINKAVVGSDVTEITLNLGSGIGVTNSIVKKTRGTSILIPAIKYDAAVAGATVVKIDVEGAEYDFNIVQPGIRAYILEFHPVATIDWKSAADRTIQQLKGLGFTTVYEPGFTNGWDLHGAWVKHV